MIDCMAFFFLPVKYERIEYGQIVNICLGLYPDYLRSSIVKTCGSMMNRQIRFKPFSFLFFHLNELFFQIFAHEDAEGEAEKPLKPAEPIGQEPQMQFLHFSYLLRGNITVHSRTCII